MYGQLSDRFFVPLTFDFPRSTKITIMALPDLVKKSTKRKDIHAEKYPQVSSPHFCTGMIYAMIFHSFSRSIKHD
ncbi:MAG: hypothetical protein HY731_09210 [Candidatus Tectomicrobia bacterium]|nr:hypothetical protein [Candidatus Tectomicrobia bacterium]